VANQPEYFSHDYDDEPDPAPRRTRKPGPPLHPAAAAVAGGCLMAMAAALCGVFVFVAWRVFRTLDLFFS
jgi:hypothetical protein